ncbi:MAG: alpha/beta fold hydrolase [Proteobacteria bacterium]|nr:alpha/beta fold hydrolase [Pseudomonadota bacterium]
MRHALLLTLLLLVPLGGCPRFHAEPFPNAPDGAKFVDVDGVHVRYLDQGEGPAVVFVHGFGASADSWKPVLPAAAQHHRAIAVDLKGFGWTTRPEGDYSPAAQARLVWGVLDQLGVKDVAIVGHSWGSSVSLAMAVAHPDRVRRVALYDAYVYDEQIPAFFRWAQKSGIGELLFALYYQERIEDRAPLAYYDARWITQARIDRVEADMAHAGTTAAALAAVRGHHFAALHDQLRGFTKPVLLLWGENDEITPVRFGYRLAAELKDATLVTYARCGHIPMVEAHAASTRDLIAFLARDDAAPATTPTTPAVEPTPEATGGGGGGGGSGTETATVELPQLLPPEPPPLDLPIGADLAALGAELTPRKYAAPREHVELVAHGGFRVQMGHLFNLDLDRGLDSRGQPVFPIPLGGGQEFTFGNLRARTDFAAYAPGMGVAVKARVDLLDVPVGANPSLANGSPATATGQEPSAVVVKRAWGEVLLPFGTLAAGRMGAHLGMGIVANGGDCEDCDHDDASDRIALVSPIAGHVLALAYDITSRGPFTRSRDGGRAIALDPTDRVGGPTAAIMRVHTPGALARRAAAGLVSTEYAAYITHRTQDTDVPASYLPTAAPRTGYTPADLVARGFSATGVGAWLRITSSVFRVEAELAYGTANIDQPSLVPGASISTPVTSQQVGFALQTSIDLGPSRVGFDGGYASGDDAPGFGAHPQIGETAPTAGAFDGPQANLPRDHTVDNFRFHPDFRVDQILFREILGTITDAIYLRPHAQATLLEVGSGRLEAGAALIASWAVEATSTPSGQRALGVELDPQVRYASADGFAITLDYGVLFPGAGFDNTNLAAKPAQTVRFRLGFQF